MRMAAPVLGYSSLAPASVEYARGPEVLKRCLARYDIPAFRLGRLAVDRSTQGQGLGGQLLLTAGRRCILAATEVGGDAIRIVARNERVTAWYESYGALPLRGTPRSLLKRCRRQLDGQVDGTLISSSRDSGTRSTVGRQVAVAHRERHTPDRP